MSTPLANMVEASAAQVLGTAPSYRVHLEMFEGPFDLLLFFIERDELDVHDIPIHRITQDFLAYMMELEAQRIEIASEFIVVAAQLMKIKGRMLLPRPELDEAGQVLDPRAELVDRLLAYRQFKQVVRELEAKEADRHQRFARGWAEEETRLLASASRPEDELFGLDLVRLHHIFAQVLEKASARHARPRHVIQKYAYNADEVRAELRHRVRQAQRLDFASLADERPDRIYLIFCFLAILELVQQRHMQLVIGDGYNNFWLVDPAAPKA